MPLEVGDSGSAERQQVIPVVSRDPTFKSQSFLKSVESVFETTHLEIDLSDVVKNSCLLPDIVKILHQMKRAIVQVQCLLGISQVLVCQSQVAKSLGFSWT